MIGLNRDHTRTNVNNGIAASCDTWTLEFAYQDYSTFPPLSQHLEVLDLRMLQSMMMVMN